jgi:hypothetical protein
MEPSPCTPPHQELSKDAKNMIWSLLVRWISSLQNKRKQTNLPSFIDRFTLPTHTYICTFVSWLFCSVCWNWVACKIYLTQGRCCCFYPDLHTWEGLCSSSLEPWKTCLPFKENWALLCSEMRVIEIHVSWRAGWLWSLNCRYNCMLWWYPIGNKPEMCFVLVAGEHSHQIQGPSHCTNNLVVVRGPDHFSKVTRFQLSQVSFCPVQCRK